MKILQTFWSSLVGQDNRLLFLNVSTTKYSLSVPLVASRDTKYYMPKLKNKEGDHSSAQEKRENCTFHAKKRNQEQSQKIR